MTMLVFVSSLLLALVPNQTQDFSVFYNERPLEEKLIMDENNIDSFVDLNEYIASSVSQQQKDDDPIYNVELLLESTYSEYEWIQGTTHMTSDVSGGVPINMQGFNFPRSEILSAIENTGVNSDYGGCGPIAMMGVMEYFSRVLGYNEIIEDSSLSADRVTLAEEVLEESLTFELIGGDTLMYPWDYVGAFNNLMEVYGLESIISAQNHFSVMGRKEYLLEIIKENVAKGLPVTLYTSIGTTHPGYSQHYTTIYGHEKWVGLNHNTNNLSYEEFLIGRVNFEGWDVHTYANTDILNDFLIGVITYDIAYDNGYNISASDFADEFVNDSGSGQYFFSEVSEPVTVSPDRMIYTKRLRTSYIENEYLTLSPTRAGAGVAYLDIQFPHSVSSLTFDIAMWSPNENADDNVFKIQYFDETWVDHIYYDTEEFIQYKEYPSKYEVLFNKHVNRIRFYTLDTSPSGSRNKGRIILDNLKTEYNL